MLRWFDNVEWYDITHKNKDIRLKKSFQLQIF